MVRRALLLNEKDNVATSLRPLAEGERIELRRGARTVRARLRDAIPFGHKFALISIAAGEPIIKYGETIGVAVRDIEAGAHVHVHNVESTRARAGPEPRQC